MANNYYQKHKGRLFEEKKQKTKEGLRKTSKF